MIVEVRAGTPSELEVKRVNTPASVKGFFRTRIGVAEKFASKFSIESKEKLVSIRREIDDINVKELPEGSKRSWSATEPVSQVTWLFEMEMIQR